jgi:hypothetical protein
MQLTSRSFTAGAYPAAGGEHLIIPSRQSDDVILTSADTDLSGTRHMLTSHGTNQNVLAVRS